MTRKGSLPLLAPAVAQTETAPPRPPHPAIRYLPSRFGNRNSRPTFTLRVSSYWMMSAVA